MTDTGVDRITVDGLVLSLGAPRPQRDPLSRRGEVLLPRPAARVP